ncbi:MAG: DUF3794 domain-containing protein [Bacteroidota bacterium]
MNTQAPPGGATTQTLVASTTILGVPAVKIDEIVASVVKPSCTVIANKVIFQATLHKQIFFVDAAGFVRHQAEDVPFSGFIDFPGATDGTPCQLEFVIEFLDFQLLNPTTLRQTAVLAVTARLFDPPSGAFFLNTAPTASDTFFPSQPAFRTSGRRNGPGRVHRVRLGVY